ncbi:MAG: prolyl oligopeptidase family serine peptidase [Actinophytocola sp.]|uniref:prolyl oligopeptidase family serine peptidase n=1 Tax=Actinophytocola sp. TaxID=1872138 RepID=UPI00132BE411|nr:prolyl oligopeptidase family serine peptidase [Actinophytocola sp.]MPZ82822.1 prolyl oligopeptidase family serine peptidase [Actinophytocola sp.]
MTEVPQDDPYLWLEDVTGDTALDWVRERNAETVTELTGVPRFAELRDEIREVLDADDRIPYPRTRGEYLYNFWQDAAHPRGLWRRTTLESYRGPDPEWEVVLDVDALGEAEGENWVWQGAAVLRPGYRHALVELSRGGADAAVVREFDLVTLSFVDSAAGGFTLPEAKSRVGWIDEDRIYVGTDFGEGSLTSSGYPRIAKEWRRGTPLDEATVVFEGKPDDVSAGAYHDPTEGFERDFVYRNPDFYRTEEFLRTPGGLVRIEVPEDAETSVHREWLLVSTRSEWTAGDTTYPAGALLAARFDDFLAGDRDLDMLFEPDEHTSLSYEAWTRNHLVIATLEDVKSRFEVLTLGPDGWSRAPLAGVPEVGSADILDTDPDVSDEYFLNASGYTQPATLHRGVVGGEVEVLKRAPAFFDARGLTVEQHFATSDDGTRIPYFVVGRENAGPTLLTGYGGFEVSLTPGYSGTTGRGWLARGGTYVVANIRGGGEYGPTWHQSVQRGQRLRVYEDFAAVAKDLLARGITTPARLGIQGGSNGGLLMGVMLTRYPELFGAIVCQVPLLDMRRYHQLLAGASWMAEYGDPDDPADWAFLGEYSPYQNVHSGRVYPPTFFLTSTRDDRVHPGHARKMVARMRALGHDVRYHENIEGGHGGAADNEQLSFKWALVFEFLWERLGDQPPTG